MPRTRRYASTSRTNHNSSQSESAPASSPLAPTPAANPPSVDEVAPQESPMAPVGSSSLAQSHENERYWTVDVVDENNVKKQAKLTVHEIWGLPSGQRVVVPVNDLCQPVEDAAGILGGFLGSLASDVSLFPISYTDWREVPQADKERLYRSTIKGKFDFADVVLKKWVMHSLAKKWKDNRCNLFKLHYKPHLSFEENVVSFRPTWIPQDMWAAFLRYRLDPKTVKMAQTNAANRQKLVIPHTGGSKSIARKRHEMDNGGKMKGHTDFIEILAVEEMVNQEDGIK